MKPNIVWGAVILLAVLAAPRPAAAQIDQSITVSFGYFVVRGEDARVDGDVLVENLSSLAYELADFNNATIAGEYLVGLGRHLEAGVGVGYYRRTVPSVYRAQVHQDGREIEQDLRLRIMPVTATVRVFPLGRDVAFQPYLGAGVGLYRWRYSEVGEFVDFRDNTIFREQYVAEGSDAGPIILGGVRFPIGSRLTAGGELRFQRARGTAGIENGFLADEIDLGGVASHFTVQVRF